MITVNRLHERRDIAPTDATTYIIYKCLNDVGQRNKRMTRPLTLCQGNNLQSSHPSIAISVPCTEQSAAAYIAYIYVSAEVPWMLCRSGIILW